METMNVLSLFDGMSCGLVALKRAGIKVDNYFASEIDKWAIKIAKKNHPGIIHLGDIHDYEKWELPKIDLILAGPPCQGFSCSGNRLDFNDPRSQLFFKAIEILWDIQKISPEVKFLIENVSSMRGSVRTELTELLEVDPIEINSNLVSAQNRNRNYWSNLNAPGRLKDKGIFLKDIVQPESEVDEKYYLKENSISGKRSLKNLSDGIRSIDEKSRALTANGARKFSGSGSTVLIIQVPRGKNAGGIKAINGKCPTISGSSWQHNNRLIFIGGIKSGRRLDNGKNLSRNFREGYRIYSDQGKAGTLTANTKGGLGGFTGLYEIGYYIRRLTPIECERLQTIPDNYTEGVSNTQRYKMIGNGWTVDVIKHIFESMEDYTTTN
jgi:DNA (cytosine-5)-methyltransferase 3A